MRTEMSFTIYGREEDIETIRQLLRHIEYLGNVGASRNLLVHVDGDGSGRIKVVDEYGRRLDNEQYNIKQNLGMGATVAVYDIG